VDPIQIRKLCRNYGKKSVLQGLDLTVPQGAIYGLVGASGTGKSTTIQILMNLQKATSGESRLLDIPSQKLGPRELTRIGYVSENQQLPEWMTVDYFLAYVRGFYPKWDLALEADLRQQMDLPGDRRLRDLSRGMKMKAALVSVLSYRPEVLILDEPFTGLDPLSRDEFIEGLLDQAGEMTILLSSHDLAEMESFASHIGYLEGGKLRFSEETASLSARFREVLISGASIPEDCPADWLQPETAGSVLRFFASNYKEGETEAQLRSRFTTYSGLEVRPMNLRQIFVALARGSKASKRRLA
jgi:ABC-2 type transport system ATP-binding protein